MKHLKKYKVFEKWGSLIALEEKLSKLCDEWLCSILDIGFTYYVDTDGDDVVIDIYAEDEEGEQSVFSYDEIKEDVIVFIQYLSKDYKVNSIHLNNRKYSYSDILNDDIDVRVIEMVKIFVEE